MPSRCSELIMLQQSFDALRPSLELSFRRLQMVAAVGVELHLHLAGDMRAGAGALHIFNHVTRPAAVGHEGDDGFATEVLPVQEGFHRRSHRVPPRRRTHGDDVVSGDVRAQRLELRLEATLNLALPLLHNIVIAAGIGHGGVDLQQLASGYALERFRNALGVAVLPTNNKLSKAFS